MRYSTSLLAALLLLPFSGRAGERPSPAGGAAALRPGALGRLLSGSGLSYSGDLDLRTEKDYVRGGSEPGGTAFRTVCASGGGWRLRLELTRNIGRSAAERTMEERFSRIHALYSGGAAYPGMITSEIEVPARLRPYAVEGGPGGNRAEVLAATGSLAYGAGAEDLVVYRGILGYLYCEGPAGAGGTLAQVELFLPKKNFSLEKVRSEINKLGCAPPAR